MGSVSGEFLKNTSRILVRKKQMEADILTRTMGSVSDESLVYHRFLKEYLNNSGRKKVDESGYLREQWFPFPVNPS